MENVTYFVVERLRDSEYVNKKDVPGVERLLKKLEWDKEYTINDDKIEVIKELMK